MRGPRPDEARAPIGFIQADPRGPCDRPRPSCGKPPAAPGAVETSRSDVTMNEIA